MTGILQRKERKLLLKFPSYYLVISSLFLSCNSLFVYKYKQSRNGRPEELDIQAILPIYGNFSIVMSQTRRRTLDLPPTLFSTSVLDQPETGWPCYSSNLKSNMLINGFNSFEPQHYARWRHSQRSAATHFSHPRYTKPTEFGGRV